MILYFADRNLNILDTASTELPGGIRILSDTKKETIETGSKTFECTLLLDKKTRLTVPQSCQMGNFLLRSAGDGNEFYTIIETEFDTLQGEFYIYAEDAGLDLINTQVPEQTFTAQNMNYYVSYYLTNYAGEWSIGLDESTTDTLALEFSGASTLTERLLSIADSFGCEIAFSYEVEGLSVTKKYVDIYIERGNKSPQTNIYLGREVQNIKPKNSLADMATALEVTGGTKEGQNTPVNLNGANYSSDGTTTRSPADPDDDYQISGTKVISNSAIEKWKSALDPDGLFIRSFNYDTTDKETLFTKAVEELKSIKDGALSFEVDFNYLPGDIRLGDWVNVIDDQDEIYVTARILELEISVTANSQTALLGEFIIRSSGISDRLLQLAEELRKKVLSATTITVTSSNGLIFNNTQIATTLNATVWYGDNALINQTMLEDVFGTGVSIKWYHNGTLVGTGFSYAVTSNNYSESYIVKLED